METKQQSNNYKCHFCNKIDMSKTELYAHLKKAHPKLERQGNNESTKTISVSYCQHCGMKLINYPAYLHREIDNCF